MSALIKDVKSGFFNQGNEVFHNVVDIAKTIHTYVIPDGGDDTSN